MRSATAAALLFGLICVSASADVVYTRDGRILRGAVTKQGNKVIVQTEKGKVELLVGQVLHITVKKPSPDEPAKPKPTEPAHRRRRRRPPPRPRTPVKPGEPKEEKEGPKLEAIHAFGPVVKWRHLPFTKQGSDEPEPHVFMFMRNVGTLTGVDAADVQRQIDRWRGLAHERRRKVLSNWLKPEDFVRKREAYMKLLAEAKKTHDKSKARARKYGTRSGSSGRYGGRSYRVLDKPSDQLPSPVVSALLEAAQKWGDANIRTFLTGMVHMKAKDYTRAANAFRNCCAQSPRVAGYYQGLGMALTELKENTKALECYFQVLRLSPGSRDAVEMLRTAMGNVPGGLINTKAYKEAEWLLSQYEDQSSRRTSYTSYQHKTVTWLMPDKKWRESWDSLPVPPYDRLSFRQGLGIPITKTVLLVDKEVLQDAVEVHVQIAPEVVIPAGTRQYRSYGGSKVELPPFELVSVQGYQFRPLSLTVKEKDKELRKLVKAQRITAYSLPLYEEMGWEMQKIRGRVESVTKDGGATLSAKLAPGDVSGPVFTQRDELVGFLAAKTVIKSPRGGEDQFIPLSKLVGFVERAARYSRAYGRYSGQAKRQTTPILVPGKVFIVYATRAERFQ